MCNSEQLSYHYLGSVLHKLHNNSHVSWVPLNLTGLNFKCKNEKIYIRRFWSRSTKLNFLYFTRLFKCETGMATPLVLHLIEHWLCVRKTIRNNHTLHYKSNLGAASPVEWKHKFKFNNGVDKNLSPRAQRFEGLPATHPYVIGTFATRWFTSIATFRLKSIILRRPQYSKTMLRWKKNSA